MTIALIVHGGAWNIPLEEHQAHQNGCRTALLAGFDILRGGGGAADAIETAIVILEDDPTFDAGIGSHLNQAGVVQLDAGFMEGATLQVGAVAALERIQNPIRVARHLLTSRHNMMAGPGAGDYAIRHGFPQCAPETLIVERERLRWQAARGAGAPSIQESFGQGIKPGTVGAVAIDAGGNIAAGTSTGGVLYKPVGRVGDSPLPGCGYFADNTLGGVSTTGHGESIIRIQLARSAADYCTRLHAPAAAQAAIHLLRDQVNGLGGLILIDHAGRVGFAHNTPHMAHAYLTDEMNAPEVGIRREAELGQ